MIYSMYFHYVNGAMTAPGTYQYTREYYAKVYSELTGTKVNEKQLADVPRVVADLIKESREDSFCFLITKPQELSFRNYIKEYGLEDFLAFEQPYWSTNAGHYNRTSGAGGCKLYVLQHPEHFQRIAAQDEPEITEENFINFVNWNEQDN